MKKPKRERKLYDPTSAEPFQLSRYRLERFLDCAQCFWLDLRKDVKRPEGYAYSLNSAVDTLIKRDFDPYRARQETHPIMAKAGLDAVPFRHPELENWRHTFKGMRFVHKETNLVIAGAPDDIWLVRGTQPRLSIVDAKSTSSKERKPVGDERWGSFRRQMDIYVWLLKRMDAGYPVSQTAYLLHLNGDKECESFDLTLRFDATVVPYEADDSWVEGAILAAHACLHSAAPPPSAETCEHCAYRRKAARFAP